MSMEIIILLGVFLTSVLLVLSFYTLFITQDQFKRRLAGEAGHASVGDGENSLRYRTDQTAFTQFLGTVDNKFGSKDLVARSSIRRQLIQAGIFKPSATQYYFAARILCPIIAVPLGIIIERAILGNPSPTVLMISILGSAVLGFYWPLLYVRKRIKKRAEAVRLALPDALDMLLVCIEAGSSLTAGFKRVALELKKIHPILAEQFELITLELQAGVGRSDALKHFADRVNSDTVRALVTVLVQSEALGTSLAKALNVHADKLRHDRLMRAEEAANKLPVKLSLPLALFILPSLMMLILNPVVIRISRVLLTSGPGAP